VYWLQISSVFVIKHLQFTYSFQPHHRPEVDTASNINEHEIILAGKARLARKADNLTAIHKSTVYKMWKSRRLTTLRAFIGSYRDSFAFYLNSEVVENYWEFGLRGKYLTVHLLFLTEVKATATIITEHTLFTY
jgi:hypothetical protein